MLSTMLEKQRKFQSRVGNGLTGLKPEQRTAAIKEHMLHAEHELHEMIQELPYFKHWKPYDVTPETLEDALQKAREEFIDAWHFILNIALFLELDAETLYRMYNEKNEVNHQRQDAIEAPTYYEREVVG